MSNHQPLSSLIQPRDGKMHLISSQARQAPRGAAAAMMPDGPNKMVEVEPGETFVLADVKGAGVITRIWMTTLVMPGSKYNMHHYGLLRFYWDGEETPSVEVPYGAFFGVPWGEYKHYLAEPLSCTSGGYNCQFPMAFSQGFRIEVVNQAPVTWNGLFFQIQYLEQKEQPSMLRFHAQWRRQNPTEYGTPYRLLEAKGSGHFAGMHLFMQNAETWLKPQQMAEKYKRTGNVLGALFPEMFGMGMLEGWERIYVDGESTPSVTGTGTEDYFNSGFYFKNGPFSAPYWGCTVLDYLQARCAAYRFHVTDAIPFSQSLIVDIDHGYTNMVKTDYSSVAYWYQNEPHSEFPELPPVAARLPASTQQNATQFALFTSPLWIPAGIIGLRLIKRILGKKG
jgi:hypothetical protein